MAFSNEDAGFGSTSSKREAECVSVSFSSSGSEDRVRTGHPMLARLSYHASAPIADAVFRISFFWPSGYLCAQLTNEASGQHLTLQPGAGSMQFECPVLPVIPGIYRVDVAIESNGIEIDARQRCATLCVEPGRPALGDFYIDNVWSIRPDAPNA
jgi:hypothetical protein